MPWQERSSVDLRVQFAGEWQKDEIPFAELCRRYGISRKTGYKWVERYFDAGPGAIEARTSRPHSNARAIEDDVVHAILVLKKHRPFWGPKKLLLDLAKYYP